MHNKKLFLLTIPFLAFVTGCLSGCSDEAETEGVVLRILNAEDYIYEYEEGDEEEMETADDETTNAYKMDMLDQFIEYWDALPENSGKHLEIVYDTYDTNETMFNTLKTGKTSYDVIVPSDYMVQKLASLGMLHKLSDPDTLYSNISDYLITSLKDVLIPDANGNKIEGSTISDYEYCVPYMWGTLGIMYNVDFYLERLQEIDENATEEDVHELFKSWDCLYGPYAKTTDESLKERYGVISGTFSIKDSVRDTYTVSLLHAFDDEVKASANHDILKGIINRHDSETIAVVKEDMLNLKDNAFGFETDSGKTDMTTQKIGANSCWSGDATWAITEARDNDLNLYYSLPVGDTLENKSGSNVWFDCFCMPKNAADENNPTPEEQFQYDLGEQFIEFMSQPENAAQNCYCVGYTPAVAGDDMLDYMRDCYDANYWLECYQDEISEMEPSDEGYDELAQEISDLEADILDNDTTCDYDLSYFFGDIPEATFRCYKDDAMRELRAQYPEIADLEKLAIMNDFGPEGNQALLDMWESVRTNPLPDWGWAIVVVELAAAAALGIYFVSKKITRKNLKKQRA